MLKTSTLQTGRRLTRKHGMRKLNERSPRHCKRQRVGLDSGVRESQVDFSAGQRLMHGRDGKLQEKGGKVNKTKGETSLY